MLLLVFSSSFKKGELRLESGLRRIVDSISSSSSSSSSSLLCIEELQGSGQCILVSWQKQYGCIIGCANRAIREVREVIQDT